LASLVAGLVLALVLTLGLTLTTTATPPPPKGFLIAGGDEGAVKIYIPSLQKTCELDDLPGRYRDGATMCGGLLCGGDGAKDYCLRLEGRTFSKTSVERSIAWAGHSCWDQGERGVLIMGYNYHPSNGKGDNRTTDLVSVDGSTSSPSFPLKHKI